MDRNSIFDFILSVKKDNRSKHFVDIKKISRMMNGNTPQSTANTYRITDNSNNFNPDVNKHEGADNKTKRFFQ